MGVDVPGAAVVLVDDGLATGLTMRAAFEYARRHGAREIIVAVSCASASAARAFKRTANHGIKRLVFAYIGRPTLRALDRGVEPPFGVFPRDGQVFR